ncbi:MAG: DNA-directed RNA polymerase subunit omega [Terracidiphilus sp.]
MRSDLVYSAALKIENRFLLATTVMQAVRRLHINSTRTEDTANRVLVDVARGRYAHGELPAIAPPPAIDLLLIAPPA